MLVSSVRPFAKYCPWFFVGPTPVKKWRFNAEGEHTGELATGQGQIQWSRVDVFCAPSDLKLGIPGAQRKTCGAGTNHPLAVETENPRWGARA